jgi:hypothetical protein
MVYNVTPYWKPVPVLEQSQSHSSQIGLSQSNQSSFNNQVSASAQQSASQGSAFSQSYIPEYSQTPILESIAKQAQNLAPEVYNWGMDQYYKNQGNIDSMMRNAMTYASPQRIASEMGRAQAGVQQGAEAGRQSAIKDLQSFGVDPSSGRYAALDQASRVMSGAAAAGAGNQQREATVAQGGAMQSAAQGASMQNEQIGYGAGAGANALLNTASQLKYSPLGTMSGSQQSSQSSATSSSSGSSGSSGSSKSINTGSSGSSKTVYNPRGFAAGGDVAMGGDATTGGFVSTELSPSAGAKVDDVDARLNSGEFVIPKDVAAWKGQEFFYKLMATARKMRATAGQESGQGMGYAEGGDGQETGFRRGGRVPEGYSGRSVFPMTGEMFPETGGLAASGGYFPGRDDTMGRLTYEDNRILGAVGGVGPPMPSGDTGTYTPERYTPERYTPTN